MTTTEVREHTFPDKDLYEISKYRLVAYSTFLVHAKTNIETAMAKLRETKYYKKEFVTKVIRTVTITRKAGNRYPDKEFHDERVKKTPHEMDASQTNVFNVDAFIEKQVKLYNNAEKVKLEVQKGFAELLKLYLEDASFDFTGIKVSRHEINYVIDFFPMWRAALYAFVDLRWTFSNSVKEKSSIMNTAYNDFKKNVADPFFGWKSNWSDKVITTITSGKYLQDEHYVSGRQDIDRSNISGPLMSYGMKNHEYGKAMYLFGYYGTKLDNARKNLVDSIMNVKWNLLEPVVEPVIEQVQETVEEPIANEATVDDMLNATVQKEESEEAEAINKAGRIRRHGSARRSRPKSRRSRPKSRRSRSKSRRSRH